MRFSVKTEFIKKMNKDPDSFPKEVSFGDEIQGTKPIRVCQHKNSIKNASSMKVNREIHDLPAALQNSNGYSRAIP